MPAGLRHGRACLLLAFSGVLLASPAAGGEPVAGRPLTALVLSGGGARGLAHVGVLAVLAAQNVPVDLVVGTSMGAVIGAMYASGLTPAEIEREIGTIDWDDVFRDQAGPRALDYRQRRAAAAFPPGFEIGYDAGQFRIPQGVFAGQKLRLALREILFPTVGVADFDRLAVPFRAVALDLESGETVRLGGGDVTTAVMASMAVPGVFPPVSFAGRLLVDGGITANLPVEAAIALGAERIIAVDVTSPLLPGSEDVSLVDVFRQVLNIVNRREVAVQKEFLGPEDILVTVDLEPYANTDFRAAPAIIAAGASAAAAVAPDLAAFAASGEEFAAAEQRRVAWRGERPPPVADEITVLPVARLSPRLISGRLRLEPGETLTAGALTGQMEEIYRSGFFDRVDYCLREHDGRRELVIEPRAKPWGPNYLYLGLAAGGNFEGDSDFSPRLRYRLTTLNPRGAELELVAGLGRESVFRALLHQPLDWRGRFFALPYARYRRRRLDYYEADTPLARYICRVGEIGLELGAGFGPAGEAALGLCGERRRSSLAIGAGLPPETTERDLFLTGRLSLDTLDNPAFPARGARLALDARRTLPGRSAPVSAVAAESLAAWTGGRNTLLAGAEYRRRRGHSPDGPGPFALGGFQRLAGFLPGQLSGDQLGLVRLDARRRFPRRLLFLGGGYYLGAALEGGQAGTRAGDLAPGNLRWSGTLYFTRETFFGPFSLAWGFRDARTGVLYFQLGQDF